MRATKVLLGCYRTGDANDPEIFGSAIAAILQMFPIEVVQYVTDPRTGLPGRSKWMPTPSEVREACYERCEDLERIKKQAGQPKPNFTRLPPPEARQGDWAHLFVPDTHPRYQSLLAWSETADFRMFWFDEKRPGIWIALSVWETGGDAMRQVASALPSQAA